MTQTMEELTNSPEFWNMRYRQQLAYIECYKKRWDEMTRPDRDKVLASAEHYRDVAQANLVRLLHAKVIQ